MTRSCDTHGVCEHRRSTHAEVPRPSVLYRRWCRGTSPGRRLGPPGHRRKACSSVGGKLDSFYYALGDTDVITIMDLPDNVAAVAIALLVAASGKVAVKTTVLLTPEEVDAAVKVGGDYRPPGG
ncbi:MAG: GYD domain-containing protein [Acidimicrobiales bacterium]